MSNWQTYITALERLPVPAQINRVKLTLRDMPPDKARAFLDDPAVADWLTRNTNAINLTTKRLKSHGY